MWRARGHASRVLALARGFRKRGAARAARVAMMLDVLLYLLLTLVVAGAVTAGVLFLRGYVTGTPATAAFFGPKPERRLAVVEQSTLDGRRKLVLIRRDDVEHLIMTGGPVDVIVETGIVPKRAVRG